MSRAIALALLALLAGCVRPGGNAPGAPGPIAVPPGAVGGAAGIADDAGGASGVAGGLIVETLRKTMHPRP